MSKAISLTPNWIVGFVEGDGHFRAKKDSSGYTRCSFIVSQDKRSVDVLYAMREYFQCGFVHKAGGNVMEFSVGNRKDLVRVIIPFFDSHSFITAHRFNQFLSLRNALGATLSNPSLDILPTRDWLSGFIDAEGCFYVAIFDSPSTIIGVRVIPKFFIGLGEDGEETLQKIKEAIGVGYVRQRKDKSWIYEVSALEDLCHVSEFLGSDACLLKTTKKESYVRWRKILLIMRSQGHHTQEGLSKIRELKNQMNCD